MIWYVGRVVYVFGVLNESLLVKVFFRVLGKEINLEFGCCEMLFVVWVWMGVMGVWRVWGVEGVI